MGSRALSDVHTIVPYQIVSQSANSHVIAAGLYKM